MVLSRYRHPVLFLSLSLVIPWALWALAAALSHRPEAPQLALWIGSLGLLGLFAPVLTAAVLILVDPHLRKDVARRFLGLSGVKPVYAVLTGGLMLTSILAAQALSLLFGHSASQFNFASQLSFTSALFPAWLLLLGAPVVEELAWHTYGTDCLVRKGNLFWASMGFALYWALWHIPLSWIDGYYHANLVLDGWIYGLNFLVSVFPFVLLMNWLYFKTGRNILVAVVFHLTANLFNEVFATHPDSKVIQTGLLIVLAASVVWRERALFFGRDPEILEG